MTLPSFSIAEMMVIVAIVALDCLVLRVAIDIGIPYLILSGSPMQIALVIGLLFMFRRRRQTEKSSSFLIGFEVVGWMGHVIYVVLCVQAVGEMDRHIGATPWTLLRAIGWSPLFDHNILFIYCVTISYVTAPQLAAALFAGWLTQRWWKRTHPETVPTHE